MEKRYPFFSPQAKIEVTHNRLPHWQQGDAWIFVTWRLEDSVPKGKLDQWRVEREHWLKLHPEPWDPETEAEYHNH